MKKQYRNAANPPIKFCSMCYNEEKTEVGFPMNIFRKKAAKLIALLCVAILSLVLISAVYLGDYYRADMDSIQAFAPEIRLEPYRTDNGSFVFEPEDADAGFIFYPGGKVEHTAYLPLMEKLASEGILCVLVEMPFRLAVLDLDAAAGIPEQYPRIKHWYIGGHSLGGSMAASYIAECPEAFEGLILLGSYSTADLSAADLTALSIYSSEDRIMNREKYQQSKDNLPEDLTEIVIDGGCHAYFGMYGPQDGDGTPAITNEEQILLTAQAILDTIGIP